MDPTFQNGNGSVVSAPAGNIVGSDPPNHPMNALLNEYRQKHGSSNTDEEPTTPPNHPMTALLDEYKRKHTG